MICKNLSVSEDNHLLFAGQDTVALAKQYGTPLYLMDEERIRENCRTYLTAVKETFGDRGKVLFASKAASFKRIYEIMKEEGMCTDVVSSGEIYTANKAGFPLENAYFHSNNKTDEDIQFAMQLGVGYFVVDSADELQAINRLAKAEKKTQNVLLRLTPGIDPHTFAAVSTGKVDSKFGSAIETGQAEEITKLALSLDGICLRGFHCHVGSQVFDSEVFYKAVDVMLEFIADMKQKYRYEAEELDLGGGYGVRYVESDPTIDIAANIHMVGDCIHKKAQELGVTVWDEPRFL
ncbi:MAG TPA: diaminopimelate decarboxylase, partial [Clostridiales bacterium]|nr:diaminopimelate decarboxylase [Clostridiales bacterium]